MVTGWSQTVKKVPSHINQHPAPLDTWDSIQEVVGPKPGSWEASLLRKSVSYLQDVSNGAPSGQDILGVRGAYL